MHVWLDALHVVQRVRLAQQLLVERQREAAVQVVAVEHRDADDPTHKVKVRQVLLRRQSESTNDSSKSESTNDGAKSESVSDRSKSEITSDGARCESTSDGAKSESVKMNDSAVKIRATAKCNKKVRVMVISKSSENTSDSVY